MSDGPYLFEGSANDALPLEYKLQNRHPQRQVNVRDFINNAPLQRVDRPEERGLKEELLHVLNR